VKDIVQRECEEMKFKDKIKPLDDLFTSFFMFAPIVPIMVVAFGLDHRLLWFHYFMFLAWVIYIYWYRACMQLMEYIYRLSHVSFFLDNTTTISIKNTSKGSTRDDGNSGMIAYS